MNKRTDKPAEAPVAQAPDKPKPAGAELGRRRFLQGAAGAAGAALLVPATPALADAMDQAVAPQDQAGTYHETEHIRRYYASARVF